MSWSRVEDDMDDNRKLQRLSDAAFRLYWVAIPWARRHKTGGRLFEADVLQLCAKHRLKNPPQLIAELLEVPYDYEVGCWIRVRRGVFEIHDFDDYNPPTSAERMARKRARERDESDGPVTPDVTGSDAGVTSHSVTSPVTSDAPVLASTGPSRARPRAGYPDPVPEPVPVEGFSPKARQETEPARRAAAALSSQTDHPDAMAYAARWMERRGLPPSPADREFFARVPYECDRLSRSVVLTAIDELFERFAGRDRMPPAKYLAGPLAELQAAASDAGVTARSRSPNGHLSSVASVLPAVAPLVTPDRGDPDDD